jgi:hypothetical protein
MNQALKSAIRTVSILATIALVWSTIGIMRMLATDPYRGAYVQRLGDDDRLSWGQVASQHGRTGTSKANTD